MLLLISSTKQCFFLSHETLKAGMGNDHLLAEKAIADLSLLDRWRRRPRMGFSL